LLFKNGCVAGENTCNGVFRLGIGPLRNRKKNLMLYVRAYFLLAAIYAKPQFYIFTLLIVGYITSQVKCWYLVVLCVFLLSIDFVFVNSEKIFF
jgi:hypothetical protein